jgi:antitoxin component of RelBE/YafQ-DinJ toxin-antitoxin module
MAKLTLSVDDRVVLQAKKYAKSRGVSVSAMIETYLAAVAAPSDYPTADTPVLRSVRGVLKEARIEEYRKHLQAKYR